MDESTYSERLSQELAVFTGQEKVHALPAINAYYAMQTLVPRLLSLGYESTHDFFTVNIARIQAPDRPTWIASYGAGNAELEIAVAARLRARGVRQFHFDCIDVNYDMLERARKSAAAAGLSEHFTFIRGDATAIALPRATYDVHIAFQFLHHVVELERLFERIDRGMTDASIFLTNDMVGRNGHQRWPETLVVVEKLWSLLPTKYRYHRLLERLDSEYADDDCSAVGFEGVRAEDVLPLLDRHFDFEEFVGWGGIADPFVDRGFGPNFDPKVESDRRFLDLTARLEIELQAAGMVKPTQIIARLRKKHRAQRPVDVSAHVRRAPPAQMPSVDAIQFEFPRWFAIIAHTARGPQPDPHLVSGFYDWEAEGGHRWTRRQFALYFDAPVEAAPYLCHLAVEFSPPVRDPGGGVDVFVNNVHVTHIPDVYAKIASNPEKRLATTFTTLGGPMTVGFHFERAQYTPAESDARELAAVVRGFSASAERI